MATSLLPDDYIERVIQATDIVSLVREQGVTLRKSGAEFVGKCPFHKEASASFSVNPDRKVYLCRGCAQTGNALQFLTESAGMRFLEAVEFLAKRAGMETPDQIRGRSPKVDLERTQINNVLTRAAELYAAELHKSAAAKNYLSQRGVRDTAVQKFAIGFAPASRTFLVDQLKDVEPSILEKAGLAKRFEGSNKLVDFMSSRVVFPISNSSGQVIAFGGRTLLEDVKPKYLNTPETALFRKGEELYGLHQASRDIRKANQVIVTEGYLDVVLPSDHGVTNSVCAMGTALQPFAIERLFRLADQIVYCFDGDAAGRRAAFKALELTAPMVTDQKRCAFAFLPSGMDPDEYVKAHGADGYREFLAKAQPMSRYLVSELKERHDVGSIEGKASFAAAAMVIVNTIDNALMRSLMTEGVREVVGQNIPLPERVVSPAPAATASSSSTSAGPSTAAGKGIFARHAKPAPAASSEDEGPPPDYLQTSGRTPTAQAPTPRMPWRNKRQESAPVLASNDSASLPLRMISILMREPSIANFIDLEWLTFLRASTDELDALRRVHETIVADPEKTPASLAEHFRDKPEGEVVARACALDEGQLGVNPIEQMEGIFRLFEQRSERAATLDRLRKRTKP